MAQINAADAKRDAAGPVDMIEKVLDVVPGLRNDRDRKRFVIKVYSLVTIMLLVTSVWTYMVYASVPLALWVFSNLWLYYIMLFVTIGIMCSMICGQSRRFR